jgi:hypothetical protein
MAFIVEYRQDLSPEWALPLLASLSQECHLTAKTLNDAIEIWYMRLAWVRDNAIPQHLNQYRRNRLRILEWIVSLHQRLVQTKEPALHRGSLRNQ